jgi:hypothetical protein
VAPAGCQHLHLKRSLAARQIHLLEQLLRCYGNARGLEHRGQRRRSALVILLLEKRVYLVAV